MHSKTDNSQWYFWYFRDSASLCTPLALNPNGVAIACTRPRSRNFEKLHDQSNCEYQYHTPVVIVTLAWITGRHSSVMQGFVLFCLKVFFFLIIYTCHDHDMHVAGTCFVVFRVTDILSLHLARGCSEELHYDRPAISPPLRLSFYVSV